ncbi:MAG: hypothetical protein PHI28_10860, partial [Mangrovibacterium sp.]|nr:hypothetical protein [Mangrovibacterium sp.]
MNERIKTILDNVFQKKHHVFRQNIAPDVVRNFAVSLKEQKVPDVLRAQKRLSWVLENEKPVILPGEKIVFMRTVPKIPEIFTEEEWTEIREEHYIHELGRICNISSNYSYTIEVGLEQRRKEVLQSIDIHSEQGDKHGVEFLQAVIHAIDDIEKLADRYAELAINSGREDIFSILNRVPREGAKTF